MKKSITCILFVVTLFSHRAFATGPISKTQYGFIENKGQVIDQDLRSNPAVLFLYHSNGLHVQLKKTGFSYEVVRMVTTNEPVATELSHFGEPQHFKQQMQIHRVDISFAGASTSPTIQSAEPAADYINYYTVGTGEEGVLDVHHYKKVLYQNVYPHVDVEFLLDNEHGFKYNFVVRPGGDVKDIRLQIDGANATAVTKDGHILIETAYGNIDERLPYTYQWAGNNPVEITAEFTELNDAQHLYGVTVGAYDATNTLVIDPAPWATYYGGTGDELGTGITVDINGNIFATGLTFSTSAMASAGAYQTTFGGTNDAYITKFSTAGSRVWSTYYGGSSYDASYGITTDIAGNVMVSGFAQSTSGIASTGAHQTVYGGGTEDAFIVKLNAAGARQWATYYGGSAADGTYGGIGSDFSGNIYVTGYAGSAAGISTAGSHQATSGGGTDAFLVKFDALGVRQWGTYYGGASGEEGKGLTCDLSGNITIAGTTSSTTGIATAGSWQSTFGGSSDAFIAQFNSSGVRAWGTYHGASGDDNMTTSGTNLNGDIFITGFTTSATGLSSAGAHQATNGGGPQDGYVAKFNSSGVRQWSTYYGGSASDQGYGVTGDLAGNVLVSGYSASTSGIASTGSHQAAYGGGGYDAFVVKFNATGTRLWGTYYGGSNSDNARRIAVDSSGNAYVTGYSSSTSAIARQGAHQFTIGGGDDAFIAAFTSAGVLPVHLTGFAARKDGQAVLLTWTTASEVNNDRFEIERSEDNEKWSSAGVVKGKGSTHATSHYQFTDAILPQTKILYYRLKQVDLDNASSMSEVRVVDMQQVHAGVHIYPNPATAEIFIDALDAQPEVYDVHGKKIQTAAVKDGQSLKLDVSCLPEGVYVLKANGQTTKFVKSK